MILFTLNNIELEFNADDSILTVRWIGALEPKEFTIIWQQVLSIVATHQIRFILLDATFVHTQNSPAIDNQDSQSYFTQILPLPSLEKIARVVSSDIIYDQKITHLYSILQQQNQDIQFKNFNYYYEAIDWLLEKPYVKPAFWVAPPAFTRK